jgi:hypothetical protein
MTFQLHLAFDRVEVAGDRFQQCRLATAGGTQNDEPVGGENLKADPVGRRDQVFLGLVLDGNAIDVEDRFDGG